MILRPLLLVALCAALVVGCGGGDDRPGPRPDPLRDALAYLPAQALAVGVVSTELERGASADLAARLGRVPATELLFGWAARLAAETGHDLGALRAQSGNPVLIALPDLADATRERTPLAAWTVRDAGALRDRLQSAVDAGRLEPAGTHRGARVYRSEDGTPAYARAGGVLLIGKDAETLRLALDRRAERRGMTPRALEERLEGTPARAPVRLSASAPVALAGPAFAELRRIPWIAALERITLSVDGDAGSITATMAFDTSESDLVVGDLPVAGGAGTPTIPQYGAVRAGLREPTVSLLFARRAWAALNPSAAAAFDTAVGELERTGVSFDRDLVGNLAGPALVATDLEDNRLRVGLQDPEAFAEAFSRARFLLPPVFDALGLPGLQFTVAPDGASQVSRNAVVVARLAVVNGQLVASTREPDLERVERAARSGAPEGLEGALVVQMASDRLRATAARLVGLPERNGFALDGVGDGTLVVRAEPDEVRATLRFEVG